MVNVNLKNIEALISSLASMLGIENFNFQALLSSFLNYFGLKDFSMDAVWEALETVIAEIIRRWIVSIIVTAVITGVILLAYYIISSIAWHKLGKKHNVKFAWLAWIPFLRTYVIGESATAFSDMKFFGKIKLGYVWLILMFFPLAQSIFMRALGMFYTIPYIGVIFKVFGTVAGIVLTVLYFIFKLSVLFRIYTTYVDKKYAALYTVLSIIDVIIPFLILSLLGKERITDGEDFEIIFKTDAKKDKQQPLLIEEGKKEE